MTANQIVRINKILAYGIIVIAVLFVGWTVFAADLPLPKPRPAPELCLQDGHQPFPGQTLIIDRTCPSGLRWRIQK